MEAYHLLKTLKPNTTDINQDTLKASDSLYQKCYDAMNDDFNSPIVIANLFEAVRIINTVQAMKPPMAKENLDSLTNLFDTFLFNILGMKITEDKSAGGNTEDALMQIIISLRGEAKQRKDYTSADNIRDALNKIGITLKDTKEGVEWSK